VEDDDSAAETLEDCIERYGREFGMEFSVVRFASAVEFLKKERSCDLVFMDIDLPGISGMEAAELMRAYDKTTPLIFVTNLAQYAVMGYQVNALDFIVKPVSYYSFSMRMDKAVRAMERGGHKRLTVATRDGISVLEYWEILYIETVKHDLVYHVVGAPKDEEPLHVRGSLTKLEEQLGQSSFLRISSSCIVNMDHIRSMKNGEIVLSTGERLYASRARRRPCIEAFADYLGGSS
jgi:DNA-binding LytR/AlgR family response regulator